ncbi:MAG TPA: signal recognition particle receptor subunit alpha, partial [Gemmatimonadales bacterium]|nr:signal recognition particle receptor subunit alpha [Gemmatimonadales bacterium]
MAEGRLGEKKLGLWARIKRLALTDVNAVIRGLNASDIETMERQLIEADFGVAATVELTEALEDEVRKGRLKTEEDLRRTLRERVADMVAGPPDPGAIARADGEGPAVVLLVGVNGTGKTTTAAK